MSPFGQVMAAAPAGQVTSQGLASLHATMQEPRHSTTQVVTLLQLIELPGPARTPQRSTSWQLYWQLAPQKAPQETVL